MDFTKPDFEFDPYKILGLTREATGDDIRRAYRRLAKEYHPDVNPDGEDRFKKITEAYELLLDPDRRAEYDRTHEDGVVVLNAVHAAVKKFVVLPSEHAAVAVTLWIAATHALPVFEHATRLAIHSAVKRSGKSRLLEIVNALAYDTIATTNTSVPALFRIIDQRGRRPPTLILDEADRLFGSARKRRGRPGLDRAAQQRVPAGEPDLALRRPTAGADAVQQLRHGGDRRDRPQARHHRRSRRQHHHAQAAARERRWRSSGCELLRAAELRDG